MPTPPQMPTQQQVTERLAEVISNTLPAVAAGVHPLMGVIDANPKGLEAVVLSAALRAYADLVELRFEEGDEMGPLKTYVDELRGQLFKMFQKAAQE